jgi:hypothetical protein
MRENFYAKFHIAGTISLEIRKFPFMYYYYYYYYYYYFVVSCRKLFYPSTFPIKPTVVPTAQASTFMLQYFP